MNGHPVSTSRQDPRSRRRPPDAPGHPGHPEPGRRHRTGGLGHQRAGMPRHDFHPEARRGDARHRHAGDERHHGDQEHHGPPPDPHRGHKLAHPGTGILPSKPCDWAWWTSCRSLRGFPGRGGPTRRTSSGRACGWVPRCVFNGSAGCAGENGTACTISWRRPRAPSS